jgi:hypothetical protein
VESAFLNQNQFKIMKVKSVEISKVFNLGNYSNLKVGTVIELEPEESAKEAVERGFSFINQYDPKNKISDSAYRQAKEVVENKRNYTFGEVEDAEKKISIYEKDDYLEF